MSQDLEVKINAMRYPGIDDSSNLIEDLAFVVPAGRIAAFIGPSGAGKTTLLRIIAGLETRFEGKIVLAGSAIVSPSRKIQLVFQDNRLLPWKTVAGNVAFALPNGRGLRDRAAVHRWLCTVRLSGRINAWPKTLSGGEEARVAFARAFMDPPKVLLLDEPFRNLDIVVRAELQRELLAAIAETNIITLLVSHSVEDAVLLSDIIYILSSDPLRVQSIVENRLSRPRRPEAVGFLELVSAITGRLL